mmetsp:Transcript_9586/g.16541  ORF Transcript_9586/g.16541 Transcript_9586/m.16541 type:complete len:426 (+) Transcript_9586:41-1318(+)|eukprot:CAMPEP_0196661152 /NCGR_PEP_ID=MMETSP1086-20130531/42967_1 /TAXON_ID=77921 /ORGANISM="Cyanoptyche  gloeocystis , Strain SAG4.97" /LENGTH=425 /DNA_ID=CAMNT_0041995921 /DNA_START=29 /DNA_END=1306 /DNA_ORIENTATION=-
MNVNAGTASIILLLLTLATVESASYTISPECCGTGLNLTGEWVSGVVERDSTVYYNVSIPTINNSQYMERACRVYVESCGGDFALYVQDSWPIDENVARRSLADPADVIVKSIEWDRINAVYTYIAVKQAGNSTSTHFRIRFTFVDADESIEVSNNRSGNITLAQSASDGAVQLSFLVPDVDYSSTPLENLTFAVWYYSDATAYNGTDVTMLSVCGIDRLLELEPSMVLSGGTFNAYDVWSLNMSDPVALVLPPFTGTQNVFFQVLTYNSVNFSAALGGLSAALEFVPAAKASPNYTLIYAVAGVGGLFVMLFVYMILIRPWLKKRRKRRLALEQKIADASSSDSFSDDSDENDEPNATTRLTSKKGKIKKAAEVTSTSRPGTASSPQVNGNGRLRAMLRRSKRDEPSSQDLPGPAEPELNSGQA